MKRKVDELQGRGRLLSPSHPPQLHPSLVPPQASSSDLDFGILAGFCFCTLKTTVNSPGTCTSLQKTSCTCLEFRPCSAGNGSTSHPAAVESSADCSFWKWMRSSGVWCSQLENHHTPHTHRSLSSSFSSSAVNQSAFCLSTVRLSCYLSWIPPLSTRSCCQRASCGPLLTSFVLGLMATHLPPPSLSLPSSLLSLHSPPPSLSLCCFLLPFILMHIEGREHQQNANRIIGGEIRAPRWFMTHSISHLQTLYHNLCVSLSQTCFKKICCAFIMFGLLMKLILNVK